jgi:hypothetical protein
MEYDICRSFNGEDTPANDIAEMLLKYAGDIDSVRIAKGEA